MSRWRSVLVGLGIATVGMAVTTGLMAACGVVQADGLELHVGLLLVGLVVFVVSGLAEELVFRLGLQGWLTRVLDRPWLALALMALVTGGFHLLMTEHTTAVSVASSTLGGVMYGVAFLRTGRIWLGLGVHVGWNWVQGTVLGFTVSGTDTFSGALLQVHTSGATWLSGGDYGPEGSVLSLVGRLVIIGLVVATTRAAARPSPGRSSSSSPTGPGRSGRTAPG